MLNQLNFTNSKKPKKGDVLVIETKKTSGKKLLVSVKDVVNDNEIILQKIDQLLFHLGYVFAW